MRRPWTRPCCGISHFRISTKRSAGRSITSASGTAAKCSVPTISSGLGAQGDAARCQFCFWKAERSAIGDSTRIIAALEDRFPEPPLYPGDAAARQHALALEDYFDEQLGPALRAAIVTPLFQRDPDIALRVLTTGMADKAYQRCAWARLPIKYFVISRSYPSKR